MENFNEPYKSKNITEFWTRWHISLSSWFRDYVYIPLGGNRKGEVRRRINVFFVFLLSGLWHGANWTFVAWGSLHGALVTLLPGKGKKDPKKNLVADAVFICINFIVVTFFWVFFRANNIKTATTFISEIFSFKTGPSKFGMNTTELLFSVLFIVIMLFRENKFNSHLIRKDVSFTAYLTLMVLVCYFFGVFGENQFIYFQF